MKWLRCSALVAAFLCVAPAIARAESSDEAEITAMAKEHYKLGLDAYKNGQVSGGHQRAEEGLPAQAVAGAAAQHRRHLPQDGRPRQRRLLLQEVPGRGARREGSRRGREDPGRGRAREARAAARSAERGGGGGADAAGGVAGAAGGRPSGSTRRSTRRRRSSRSTCACRCRCTRASRSTSTIAAPDSPTSTRC